jgi:hypothetical protein
MQGGMSGYQPQPMRRDYQEHSTSMAERRQVVRVSGHSRAKKRNKSKVCACCGKTE